MNDKTPLVTELILETFRLNGELLAAGDRLVAELGLTSARWQVLGAIEMSAVPLPVAHIARNMGLSRQGVQRTVNELAADGLVRFESNPHHARAKLVVMTAHGAKVFAAAMALQGPWAARLGARLSHPELRAATAALRSIRAQIENPAVHNGGTADERQEHN
jgi:DNA-binding MarR family transcriptional regulator